MMHSGGGMDTLRIYRNLSLLIGSVTANSAAPPLELHNVFPGGVEILPVRNKYLNLMQNICLREYLTTRFLFIYLSI